MTIIVDSLELSVFSSQRIVFMSKLLVGSSMGDAVYIVDAQSMILLHSIFFTDINMDGEMNMNNMHMPTGLAIVQE